MTQVSVEEVPRTWPWVDLSQSGFDLHKKRELLIAFFSVVKIDS